MIKEIIYLLSNLLHSISISKLLYLLEKKKKKKIEIKNSVLALKELVRFQKNTFVFGTLRERIPRPGRIPFEK